MPVPDQAIEPGRHTVMVRFSKSQSGGANAEIDWMWMAGKKDSDPPEAATLRVLPIRVGGQPKRALIAPTPRSYSFFLEPPEGASLVVDYGSEVGAGFIVRAHVDGSPGKDIFSAKGEKEWNEAQVDLGPYAGKAIRLELLTTGGNGVTGWAEPVIMVPPESAPATAETEQTDQLDRSKRPKNVLVILIDTARDDAFAPHNPDTVVMTPAYNAFAEKSTVFLNAYNNENWTKPSVATTLSSLYPSTHDTKKDGSSLPSEVELASQRFQKDGFATAGFVANGYVSKKFGFEKGWDFFRNYIRENRKSEAEYVYGDALKWLQEDRDKNKPFFLYIQTIDPHVVYKVVRDYTKLYHEKDYQGPLGESISAEELQGLSNGKLKMGARDIEWLRAVYYGEITYHDEHMGKFLDIFETEGYLEDTLVVITNDHGEELQDHGKFGHGHSLWEEMTRAPLLMHYPARFPAGKRVEEIVENVDVMPTVFEVMGLDPMKDAEGQSLLPLVEGNPDKRPFYAITEFLDGRRAVRVGNWKFMRSSSTWVHLYDVTADPKEKANKAGKAMIAQRLCEVHLGEGLAVSRQEQAPPEHRGQAPAQGRASRHQPGDAAPARGPGLLRRRRHARPGRQAGRRLSRRPSRHSRQMYVVNLSK